MNIDLNPLHLNPNCSTIGLQKNSYCEIGGGKKMAYYSDEDFGTRIGEKPGNIKVFKEFLRKYNMIEPRKQLEDKHIPMFEEIREVRNTENATWVQAIEQVLSKYRSPATDHTALLQEILDTLQRIEAKLS